jgi:hypothetical protein
MTKPIAYLYKSNLKNKKWAMFFPTPSMKVVHFGGAGYRDLVLMSDKSSKHYVADPKQRNKIKQAYQSRHAGDRLTDPESPGSLSYYVLWQMPSMKGGMRTYEKTFSYTVVDKTSETYSSEKVKKLI